MGSARQALRSVGSAVNGTSEVGIQQNRRGVAASVATGRRRREAGGMQAGTTKRVWGPQKNTRREHGSQGGRGWDAAPVEGGGGGGQSLGHRGGSCMRSGGGSTRGKGGGGGGGGSRRGGSIRRWGRAKRTRQVEAEVMGPKPKRPLAARAVADPKVLAVCTIREPCLLRSACRLSLVATKVQI